MKEIWKDVVGYEGIYKVSSMGRVMSLARSWVTGKYNAVISKPDTLISPSVNKNGYNNINLYKDGKVKTTTVHRVVATAFLPNADNKPYINHKNGIRTDNRLENIEWCTPSENNQHAYDCLGRTPTERQLSTLVNNSKSVIDVVTGNRYKSAADASRQIGVKQSYLRSMLNGWAPNKTSLKYT